MRGRYWILVAVVLALLSGALMLAGDSIWVAALLMAVVSGAESVDNPW